MLREMAGLWSFVSAAKGSSLFRRPGETTHCFKEQRFKYSVKVGGSEGLFLNIFVLFYFFVQINRIHKDIAMQILSYT